MIPLEKARMSKSFTSEYMQATDDEHVPADEVLELLTDDELHELLMSLSDAADQVYRHRVKSGLV